MARHEVVLPQWGMGMSEGTVVEWRVDVGGVVEIGDELVEIESAKTNDVVTAPVAGTVVEIRGEIDDDIPVGTVLVVIEDAP